MGLCNRCLIRNVAMTRWTICKTGARIWGWAASRKRSGTGNDNTHWRYPWDEVIDQANGRLCHAPRPADGIIPAPLTREGDELLMGAVGGAQAQKAVADRRYAEPGWADLGRQGYAEWNPCRLRRR